MAEPARAVVQQLWPLLSVTNMERSVAFYRNQLGFRLVGDDVKTRGAMGWCRLERDGACLMLEQSDRADSTGRRRSPTVGISLYFVCDDADLMHRELSSQGLRLEDPQTASYGMKQLFVPEPDGHTICFESPTTAWRG